VRLLCHHLQPGPDRHDFYLPHVRAAGVKVREINRRIADPQDAEVPEPLRQVAGALPASLLCDIANLVHEIRTLKPEVVHAFLDWDNVRAGLAAAIVGVPRIVLSGRNLNPSHFDLYQPYMDPAYRALVDLPNVHITNNSAAGAADYADWIGIARERIGVIYNAVDFPPEARPDAAVVENRKALLGLSEPGPVVGGAFRFCSEKRPLLWLEVARRVSAAVPDARFVIHGDGPLLDAMRKCAQRLGLEDRLVLPGVSDDILPSMAAMDVFLLTSEGEGIPNVLLEAQTVGTPVVATDAGGAAEAVENGITGHVLDTQDPKDLAQAVLTFLQDETAAARAASRGPELMRERFGFHQMVDATLEAYGYNLAPRSVSAAI
jgi:glycosyltransferase involved in cell wall biosynthesis